MAIKTMTIRNVPQWASTYIMYSDDSGLNDEDKKLVDDFEQKLLKQGLRLVCPVEGSENEFEPYPSFGLACDTVDWTAEESRIE
jgi:hypothetical protein